MKRLRIGLLGLGTVGTGVVKLLHQNKEIVELKTDCRLELVRVLVRDPNRGRDPELPPLELTTDPQAILGDPGIDVVVEVLGGIHPAREYILQALRAGKAVVTANKDVMAEFGREIYDAAGAGGTDVYFEASVGGGIPIIRALKESLAANHIQSILGIVNGTTNYILTKMSQEGLDFAVALKQAQDLGYAEPDPTNDVEGKDAARKLAILASIGFLSRVTPNQVHTEGITRLTAQDIKLGQRFGWTLKLLAIAKEEERGISARVHPAFIPSHHPLASVHGPLNGIFVRGDAVGETMFMGRGAGSMPTASSIVGDIIYAAQAIHSGQKPLGCTCYHDKPVLPISETVCRYFLRLLVLDQPGVLAKVARAFGDAGVNIAQVLQTPDTGTAEIILVTHQVQESRIRAALDLLQRLPEVHMVESVIRVEA